MIELLGIILVAGAGSFIFYTWYYLFLKGE